MSHKLPYDCDDLLTEVTQATGGGWSDRAFDHLKDCRSCREWLADVEPGLTWLRKNHRHAAAARQDRTRFVVRRGWVAAASVAVLVCVVTIDAPGVGSSAGPSTRQGDRSNLPDSTSDWQARRTITWRDAEPGRSHAVLLPHIQDAAQGVREDAWAVESPRTGHCCARCHAVESDRPPWGNLLILTETCRRCHRA